MGYNRRYLKLSDNPPMVSPWAACLAELSGTWRVAHTRSRFEKALAWDLLNRRIGYFLPLIEKMTIASGRRRKTFVPLFTSYVFFCGSDEDRYAAMTTNRICQTIEVADQAKLVAELSAIERALAGKAVLDPYQFAAVGRRCRITAGPFEGIEGVVVDRKKLAHVVLEVSMLGQGAAMEIDPALLEPLE